MPIEAELVYRAQDTAGRKDAAYVIQMMSENGVYQVILKWGKWEQYHNATLSSKTDYTGTALSIAMSKVVDAANKRTQRGYELQAHLSTFPAWLPTSLGAPRLQSWQSPPETRAAVKPLPPEPEPLPTGRVKHTRAGFLEL
ncbi:MAG: hypothetical protein WC359_13245 [Dehalococcoidia bacterium]|jgi:hypothetical protein